MVSFEDRIKKASVSIETFEDFLDDKVEAKVWCWGSRRFKIKGSEETVSLKYLTEKASQILDKLNASKDKRIDIAASLTVLNQWANEELYACGLSWIIRVIGHFFISLFKNGCTWNHEKEIQKLQEIPAGQKETAVKIENKKRLRVPPKK
jgi:hypothetical protein